MWPTMNAKYPQTDTSESMEGNTAHWVFAEMLEGRYHDLGTIAPNGIVVTEEMIEGAELVVDTVRERLDLRIKWHIEKPVAILRIHKECWGTPDIWAFDAPKIILEVIDYKFGHRFVDEYENDQGVSYIAGIIDLLSAELNIPVGELDQLVTVNFTVIQPRCFYKGAPVRTWTTRAVDLRGQINQLSAAANDAYPILDVVPKATTNGECGDCPGRHACSALQKAAYGDMEVAVTSVPVELSPEAAGLELMMMERSYERLGARVEGLREQVATYIRQGHPIAWYRAEQGFGQTKWTVPVEQVIAMGQLMGVDLSKMGVLTPKQAEKEGIDGSVIKAYSITPLGQIKLVPNDPSDARRIFGVK